MEGCWKETEDRLRSKQIGMTEREVKYRKGMVEIGCQEALKRAVGCLIVRCEERQSSRKVSEECQPNGKALGGTFCIMDDRVR